MKHKKALGNLFLVGAVCTILLSLTSCPDQKPGGTAPLKIIFDAEKTACFINVDDQEIELKSSDTVMPGTKVSFHARNLPLDKVVDTWTIGKKSVVKALSADIVADTSYANAKKEIAVSYTMRNTVKITVTFDSGKIIAAKLDENQGWLPMKSGDSIDEKTLVRFFASNIPGDKILFGWLYNGSSFPDDVLYKKTLFHTLAKDYADANNTMNITYNLKTPEQFTITFDEKVMFCDSLFSSWNEIKSGSQVPEGQTIFFNIRKTEEGKVPVWTINGKQRQADRFEYVGYLLGIHKTGSTRTIQASLNYRTGEMCSITFDASTIKCSKKDTGANITSGTKLLEGTELQFETLDNTNVDWFIGDSYEANDSKFLYTVFKGNVEKGTITVSYE